MNKLYLGLDRNVEPPIGNFLFIGDQLPSPLPMYAKVLDHDSIFINPLLDLNPRRARYLASVLYTLYPQGENTLTVRNGRIELLSALCTTTERRLDKIDAGEDANKLIKDILLSPLLSKVLLSKTSTNLVNAPVFVRLDRAEIDDFEALVLGLLLIGQYKGQVVLPNGDFYLRDAHISLIREKRLILGANFLDELPKRVRDTVILFDDRVLSRAHIKDAELIAGFDGIPRSTNRYHDAIDEAVG